MRKKTERVGATPLRNPKHELFAQAIAEGLSADAAYARAGYRPHRSNPTRLSGNERIRARVEHILAAGADRAEVTVERIVTELARIAFSDIGASVESWGPAGVKLRDSATLSDHQRAAIAEVSESRLRGERTVRVKMHGKIDALDRLCRIRGLYKDRVEHSGPNGGAIPIESYRGIRLDEADPETLAFLADKRRRELAEARKTSS